MPGDVCHSGKGPESSRPLPGGVSQDPHGVCWPLPSKEHGHFVRALKSYRMGWALKVDSRCCDRR